MQFMQMTRDDVIKTHFTNFNLYKHLLSIDEQKDDHKKFNAYLCKEDSINDKWARYNSIKKLSPTTKYRCK